MLKQLINYYSFDRHDSIITSCRYDYFFTESTVVFCKVFVAYQFYYYLTFNWSIHIKTKTTLKSKNYKKNIFRFWETFFHLVSHSFLIFPSSVILSNALKQRCCNVVWVFATTNAFSLRNIALKMLTLCISMQIRGETCSFLIFKKASWMSASLPLSLWTK